MPGWEGKSKGTTLGYRIFVEVLRRFGVRPAYLMLRFVAFYYFLFSARSSKHIYHYFHHRLGYGRMKSLRFLYRNYYVFGQTLIDKVILMSGMNHPFSFDFDGEHYLQTMVKEGKGGMLLSAHVGNWEAAGHLLQRLNTEIHIVIFDGEHEKIKHYISGVTGEKKVKLIIIRDDLSHIYEIMEALQNNGIVCMHADRFMEGNKVMEMEFMGAVAKFPLGPFLLASKLKVPVSFVFAMKETDLHYHFFASEPRIYQGTAKSMEQASVVLKDFAKAMEDKARSYPLQWFNYYGFWN